MSVCVCLSLSALPAELFDIQFGGEIDLDNISDEFKVH